MPRRFLLPAPPAASRAGYLARAREFLLRTWRGRMVCAALLLLLLEGLGVAVPDFLGVTASIVLAVFAAVALFRIARWGLRHLLFKIRTKLIVSYLFIAVVPLVLLGLFFTLAGVLLLGLVASHMVSSEIERDARELEAAARAAFSGLPAGDLNAAGLEARLAAARALHPEVAYVLVRGGRTLASSEKLPRALPAWWKGPGFGGLAREGDDASLRAVWSEGGAFLLLQLPLDARLLSGLEQRMGIRLLTAGGRAEAHGRGGIRIEIDGDSRREASSQRLRGLAFFAAPDATDWNTGKAELVPLLFEYAPLVLIRKLSPGSLNTADILVKLLAVVGVVFLVMYSVALLLGLLLARSITRNVHALSRGTARLRAGDFEHLIPIQSGDQLGALAESFNGMARDIRGLMRESAEKERLEEELRIARRIQMSLLPQDALSLPGLRVAALCLPAAEVGGDYYDLLPLDDGRMGLLVADVSGKGTSAALYMAELKGLVLSLSRIYDSPARMLAEANRILAANMDARSFITMTYAVVDTRRRTMRHARAGHNPVIQFQAESGLTRILNPGGIGLGLDAGPRFEALLEEAEVELRRGDVFLFFTDGLSEAMNARAELFGERRLRDLVEASDSMDSEDLKQQILSEVRRFVAGAPQHDDMTLVVLEIQ